MRRKGKFLSARIYGTTKTRKIAAETKPEMLREIKWKETQKKVREKV